MMQVVTEESLGVMILIDHHQVLMVKIEDFEAMTILVGKWMMQVVTEESLGVMILIDHHQVLMVKTEDFEAMTVLGGKWMMQVVTEESLGVMISIDHHQVLMVKAEDFEAMTVLGGKWTMQVVIHGILMDQNEKDLENGKEEGRKNTIWTRILVNLEIADVLLKGKFELQMTSMYRFRT
jgi:uncharacterized protein (DUF302 family)